MRAASPLRVLHVTAYFAPAFCYGGPPRSVLGLCQALIAAGADVEVFTTTANGAAPLPAAPEGVCYEGVRARYFPLAWPSIGWRASGLAAALEHAALTADLVHVHGLWNLTAWAGVRAAQAAGIPYVISPRGMLQPEAMARHHAVKMAAYRTVESKHLEAAALLHATSDAEARAIAGIGPPVALIPNGVAARAASERSVADMRARLAVSPEADLVLFLGRLHPIKRLDLLANAFVRVRRSGRRACLIVAGPDETGLRRQIAPLLSGVEADVRWVGAVDGEDKWALLAASRVLIQCSDSESFGLSVAEALAAGVPVIVTDRGAWNRVAAIGCGRVAAHDADGIAAALEQLLGDRAAARSMGERGRDWARQTFGWDSIGRAMLERYEAVARQSAAVS